jgi:hypothetical protein
MSNADEKRPDAASASYLYCLCIHLAEDDARRELKLREILHLRISFSAWELVYRNTLFGARKFWNFTASAPADAASRIIATASASYAVMV